LIFSGCKKPLQKSEEQLIQVRDWDEIKSSGKLIALVDNSTTSYFIYRG
jgi:hypothetical protein